MRKQTDTPFVTVDSYFDQYKDEFINVGLSDYEGGYIMGKYLLDNGHKKILFLSDNDSGVDHWRWNGFMHALLERDIPCDDKHHIILDINDDERNRQYIRLT